MRKNFFLILLCFLGCNSYAQIISEKTEDLRDRCVATYDQVGLFQTGICEIWISLQQNGDTTFIFKNVWGSTNGYTASVPTIKIGNTRAEAISVLNNWIQALESKKKGVFAINENYRFEFLEKKWFRILDLNADRVVGCVRLNSLTYLRNKLERTQEL